MADRHIPRDEALKAVRHLMDIAGVPFADLEAKGPLLGLRHLVKICGDRAAATIAVRKLLGSLRDERASRHRTGP